MLGCVAGRAAASFARTIAMRKECILAGYRPV
jgi:hypothetical protein